MTKRKIVISSNTSWYLYNFRRGLIKALKDRDYEVILISPKDNNYSKRLEDLGCKHYNIKLDNKGTNPVRDIGLMYQFYKLFIRIEPNLLLLFTIKPNIYGGIVGKILNIPTINVISGLGTVFLNDKITSQIARWLYKVSFSGNRVLFENLDDREEFIRQNLINRNQATIIPGSGIDTTLFKPKLNLKRENENITFLLIARLIKDKGIVEYIEAIRIVKERYPNAQFKILGSFYFDNPSSISEDEINSWVAEGLIEYLGYTDAVLEEIERVDCIVLPSYREGLSRVLLEAGSMSKPIITTDVAGCREVVKDNYNGFLVPPKDSKSLAIAIEKMIELSKKDRDIMGLLGRLKVINEFEEKIVVERYLSAISSCLKISKIAFSK